MPRPTPRARTVGAQTLTVAALVLLGLGTAVANRRRPSPVRTWAALATLVFWSFPLVVGRGVSLYRSEALVLPVLLLLIDLPPGCWRPCWSGWPCWPQAMGRLFFTGYLV